MFENGRKNKYLKNKWAAAGKAYISHGTYVFLQREKQNGITLANLTIKS